MPGRKRRAGVALLVVAASTSLGSGGRASRGAPGVVPENGFLPAGEVAIAIAEAVLAPVKRIVVG